MRGRLRRSPLPRAPASLALALAVLAGASGCNDSEQIALVFTAEPGTELEYVITVTSRVTTRLAGPAEVTEEEIRLDAVQEVVAVDDEGGVDLEITMTRGTERPRVFEVHLDAQGGLGSVDAVQGLPVEALGELGPSRLVLLAHGLPPTRPLRPGARWEIERNLELPEGSGVLRGRGRLGGLRHDDGQPVARVEADTFLPVDRMMTLDRGQVRLSGEEHTRARLDYLISDGTVQGVRSVTTGTFDLVVTPPPGTGSTPVEGELSVRVESRTTLVGTTAGSPDAA